MAPGRGTASSLAAPTHHASSSSCSKPPRPSPYTAGHRRPSRPVPGTGHRRTRSQGRPRPAAPPTQHHPVAKRRRSRCPQHLRTAHLLSDPVDADDPHHLAPPPNPIPQPTWRHRNRQRSISSHAVNSKPSQPDRNSPERSNTRSDDVTEIDLAHRQGHTPMLKVFQSVAECPEAKAIRTCRMVGPGCMGGLRGPTPPMARDAVIRSRGSGAGLRRSLRRLPGPGRGGVLAANATRCRAG